MAEENKMQEMIRTSMESIRAMVDANTVVGTPIDTPSGTTIIPISKLAVGYASGGFDSKKVEEKKMFAGGGGTGLSVQPVCFIAVHSDGEVEVLPLNGGSNYTPDSIDRIADIIERTPDFINKVKALFSKKKKKSDAEADGEDPVDAVTAAATEVAEAVADSKEKN